VVGVVVRGEDEMNQTISNVKIQDGDVSGSIAYAKEGDHAGSFVCDTFKEKVIGLLKHASLLD